MTDIFFAKPGWPYDSYIDFYRLAELAGFPIIPVSKLDVSRPGVFITAPMNGDFREHMDAQANKIRNAHIILWNIERPAGSAGALGKYGESNRRLMYGLRDDGTPAPCRYVDEVWVSDRRLADETSLRYVPLGSHPDFGTPGGEKVWNAVHISYEIPRRQTLYKEMQNLAPNGWGEHRDKALKQSRFGLATHQDNHPFLEPLRLAIFAAYGLPVLCETVMDAYPYGDDCMAFSSYDHYVPRLRKMLAEPYENWRDIGLRFRERACVEFEFGKVVREAVEQSVGDWR